VQIGLADLLSPKRRLSLWSTTDQVKSWRAAKELIRPWKGNDHDGESFNAFFAIKL
jgi:hypothetical protein